jgi:EPTP domain
MNVELIERQRIATSGARAVEPIEIDGVQLLAIPQLAYDVEGEVPAMHGGDSNTEMLLLRRGDKRFERWATLPAPGGEAAEFFVIDGQRFLAVASLRDGTGPYRFSIDSQIFTWRDGTFVPFQAIPTDAAKGCRHWEIGDRHFLGLAQGVHRDGNPDTAPSVVHEWDGAAFSEHQRIPSLWGYDWHPFAVDDAFFVAHADHVADSVLYRWTGDKLEPHQTLLGRGGRAFASFERDGVAYLIVAGLLDPPQLRRWDGERFEIVQQLEGEGARRLAILEADDVLLVVRINFITGTPAEPQPVLDSELYSFDEGRLHPVARFPTTGGTDVAPMLAGDEIQIVVSNSLSPELRFAADTVVYSVRCHAA